MSSKASTDVDRSTAETILEMRNANVSFDMGRGTSQVLNGVDLDIHRNEIIGVVGESGSGKSMLASAFLDAVPKPGRTGGEITFYPDDGREPIDVLNLSNDDLKQYRWEDVSMVFQGAMSSFNPTMSVRGHFEETIEAHDMEMLSQMRHARQLLEDLYLDPDRVLDSYPHELSGGMTQRALVALSLVLDPDVLVMDEPTAALDLLMQRSITSMLADLQEEYDLTIIFITHDLPLIAGFVDRLAVVYAFEIAEIGPKKDVLLDASHPYTRALLASVPNLDMDIDEMEPISGRSPDPVNVPEGCSYHPRCPLADDICQSQNPEYQPVSADHQVACFHWEQARETISYSIRENVNEGGQ